MTQFVSFEQCESIKMEGIGAFSDISNQWVKFYEHFNTLAYEEEPNYKYLISLLESLVMDEDEDIDMIFDWQESYLVRKSDLLRPNKK
jgi:hypothetical protein